MDWNKVKIMSGTTPSSHKDYYIIGAHRACALGIRCIPSYSKNNGLGMTLRVRGGAMLQEMYDALPEHVRESIGARETVEYGGLAAMHAFRAFPWENLSYQRVSYTTAQGFVFKAMDEMDARQFVEEIGLPQMAHILNIQMTNSVRSVEPVYTNEQELVALLRESWDAELKKKGVYDKKPEQPNVMDFFSDNAKYGELGTDDEEDKESPESTKSDNGSSLSTGSYFTVAIENGNYDPKVVYQVTGFTDSEEGELLVIGESDNDTVEVPPTGIVETNEDGVPLEHCKPSEPPSAVSSETLYTVGEKFSINPALSTSYSHDDVFEVTDSYYNKDGLAYVVGVLADGGSVTPPSSVTLPNIYAVPVTDQAEG